MHRPLYSALLLIAVVLTVCLRWSLAEESATPAPTWGGTGAYPSRPFRPDPNSPGGVSIPGTPHRPIPTSQPVPFPATPAPPGATPGTTAAAAPSPYPSTTPDYQQALYQKPATRPLPPVPAAGPGYPGNNNSGPAAGPRWSPCEGAEILARVGSEVVLACELAAAVNEIIEKNRDRIPPSQMDAQRELLTKQLLKQEIQYKLIYLDAKRKIPEKNLENIRERVGEQFDKKVVPERMEAVGAGSRRELDEMLRELGSSLDRQRRQFIERTMAQQWVRQQVESEPEVSHQQMLNYYQEHLADFQQPARARWQELTVRKSNYATRAEAYAALAAMGNQVLDGTGFEEVARARSEGVTASVGGVRDWVTPGVLVSEVLDDALFSLQVGALSPILEDEQGFHIIRVLQREEATVTPFFEAQVKIKEELAELDRDDQVRKYLADLEKQIPVWTAFDEEEDAEEQVSMGSRDWIQ